MPFILAVNKNHSVKVQADEIEKKILDRMIDTGFLNPKATHEYWIFEKQNCPFAYAAVIRCPRPENIPSDVPDWFDIEEIELAGDFNPQQWRYCLHEIISKYEAGNFIVKLDLTAPNIIKKIIYKEGFRKDPTVEFQKNIAHAGIVVYQRIR